MTQPGVSGVRRLGRGGVLRGDGSAGERDGPDADDGREPHGRDEPQTGDLRDAIDRGSGAADGPQPPRSPRRRLPPGTAPDRPRAARRKLRDGRRSTGVGATGADRDTICVAAAVPATPPASSNGWQTRQLSATWFQQFEQHELEQVGQTLNSLAPADPSRSRSRPQRSQNVLVSYTRSGTSEWRPGRDPVVLRR